MPDKLDEVVFYKLSLELWDLFWEDSELMIKDIRGKELVRQQTKSIDSISSNIEEGYGRGFGKEYPQFLRIARGSARESRGRYLGCKFLLSDEIIADRTNKLSSIIAMITKTIQTLQNKK